MVALRDETVGAECLGLVSTLRSDDLADKAGSVCGPGEEEWCDSVGYKGREGEVPVSAGVE